MIDDPDAGVPAWVQATDREVWTWDLGDDTALMVFWALSHESWMWAHAELVEGRPQGTLRSVDAGYDSAASAIRAAEDYERKLL